MFGLIYQNRSSRSTFPRSAASPEALSRRTKRHPSRRLFRTSGAFVSASVLAQKAKQFDDGLYAAVDLAAQSGAGKFPGKAEMLGRLARASGSGG